MPNDLTGDFDVVAQFAIPAANRVLAAMHRIERFPHSVAIRVDDVQRPGSDVVWPSTVAAVDSFGDTISDHQRIGSPNAFPGMLASTSAVYFALDPVVNMDNAGLSVGPIEPSNLQGRAQLQLFPPTIDVTDSSGTNVTVRLQMLARYFPDPNTAPVAEFVRGELRITAPVHQVASQVANVVEIDIKADSAIINFVPQWSSQPLSAEDLTAINLLIRNALRTSFLPSNSTLPSNIRHMQFKTLQGAGNAIAVLLKMNDGPGNRDSVHNLFLDGGDDFAFGVGVDFVRAAFQPTIDKILSQPVDPVSFTISSIVHTWHITYTITHNSASVELRNGEIVLTIQGHAHTPSWPPNFDFTVTQRFSLEVSGATADLVVGDVSLDTSSWIINRFRGGATTSIKKVRDRALSQSGARQTVRRMLSAEANLGGFLNSLLKPARPKPIPQPQQIRLAYSAAEIRPSGIILHGSLAVTDWPAAHAEFEQITVNNDSRFPIAGATGINQGPDYSALKSWIPGGTVQRYEWKTQGQAQPGISDDNRFVYIKPPLGASTEVLASMVVSGYVPLCLTVHGSRLSSSGSVAAQPVTATVCGVSSFPMADEAVLDGEFLMVALAQPGPRGLVQVAGHTSARTSKAGSVAPNLIVHFGDQASASDLEFLLRALRESGRGDAPTAVVAVLSAEVLATARYVAGVTYAEDQDGAWTRRFGLRITRRPVTLIVAPNGKVAWQHEGAIDSETLAGVLRKSLVAGRPVEATMQPSAVRIGTPPPNFLFEYAPGREVTLRKVVGRPVIVVFWRSTSRQSIERVRELEQANGAHGELGPILLAINDGEAAELAAKVAAENRISAIVVTDKSRHISLAYGVNTWPTTIWIDALGMARAIRHGRFVGDAAGSPFEQRTAQEATVS